ncbi:MAG: SDR family NAD(P)-dependent oxidoreductase [Muribaculaceae bacterium]|nr:SDR family NAD(P)-dependent oxidoreductase [Muribaculaceae bacterium]
MKKIAMITGATSGIGEACVRAFITAGYRVIATGRNIVKLNALKDKFGVDLFPLIFDVRDREIAEASVASLPEEWSRIDVLVNNAGLALGLDREYEGDYNDWDTMIDTNIKGLLTMTRCVVPGMVERNCGHVINIGSVAGDAAYANGNVYCATKAAVKSITDGLRIDVAHTEVRVTLLKPGLVETNFSNVRFHGDDERAANVYKGITPLTGADIADAAIYAAQAPKHVQIAEMLILATHQANGSTIVRSN